MQNTLYTVEINGVTNFSSGNVRDAIAKREEYRKLPMVVKTFSKIEAFRPHPSGKGKELLPG